MTTRLSTKLAALAIAVMMNAGLLGSVAYLFSGSVAHAATMSLA